MNTFAELEEWCEGAEEEFGDASAPICQCFFRWTDAPSIHRGEDLVCAAASQMSLVASSTATPSTRNDVVLFLARGKGVTVPIHNGFIDTFEQIGRGGDLEYFRGKKIAPGLWELSPSLNVPGVLHAFVVLHGVPDPAPWERLIVLPGEYGAGT